MRWNPLAASAEDARLNLDDPDAALMLRFQQGDLEAFEALFARHVRAVVNYAYRFVRNRDVAEELAQEVFLRIHDAGATYKPTARFTTWLYRIATNLCLNEIRRPHFRARHSSIDESLDGGTAQNFADTNQPSPERKMERQEIACALRAALEQLPEKQRIAFVLNKYQELSYTEVAEVMQVSEKAVKSLIHRAKEGMAERLQPLLSQLA